MANEAKTTYLLELENGGRRKIVIPSSWKVTYGPLVPGSKDGNLQGRGALCLRIWEGSKDNQRAVITGVVGFRDLSLPVQDEITTSHEEVVSKQTEQGMRDVVVRGEVKEWVDPDKPRPLPSEFSSARAITGPKNRR